MDCTTSYWRSSKEVQRNRWWIADIEMDKCPRRIALQRIGQIIARHSATQTLCWISLCKSVDWGHITGNRKGCTGTSGYLFAISTVQLCYIRFEFQFNLPTLPEEVCIWIGQLKYFETLIWSASRDYPKNIKWSIIDRWATHPLLVKTFAERIKDELKQFPEDVRKNVIILFSAHSLPLKVK